MAYAEAGVQYKPSMAEIKASEFESNIPAISKITSPLAVTLADTLQGQFNLTAKIYR